MYRGRPPTKYSIYNIYICVLILILLRVARQQACIRVFCNTEACVYIMQCYNYYNVCVHYITY